MMWPWSRSTSNAVITAKRLDRAKLVSEVTPYDPAQHDLYLTATAAEIVSQIKAGEWTSTVVVEAYISRAAAAHALTNCLTEILFVQARREAKELDAAFTLTGQTRGPLHGVPMSVKDQHFVAGVDACIGFSQKAYQPSSYDADIVALMRAAGAVVIAKTNVPQTMLAFECNNPLWGRSLNPYNKDFTCGGSSGGEGALVAMAGSVIGWGSDIGGSIRIPAAYCGIYAFRPSSGRIPFAGKTDVVPGQESVNTVIGPMCRSVQDIEIACRTVMGVSSGADTRVAPLLYRDIQLPPKLHLGFYTTDFFIKASPACKRGILETVDALRREGHTCTEFEVPNASGAFELFVGLTSSDGYETLLSHIGPDPRDQSLFLPAWSARLPRLVRLIVAWVIDRVAGDKQFANALRAGRPKSVHEYWRLTAEKNRYIDNFYNQVWRKHGFDGILAPVQALPGMPHGRSAPLVSLAGATILYNILDHPVGIVPVTRVDTYKDVLTAEWTDNLGDGSVIVQSRLYGGRKPLYNADAMKGLPVGIQVVGRKWEDEKVIAMMHVIDGTLGERGFGPMSI